MISFHTGTHRFHLRAAAIIVRDGALLLHRAAGDEFWALPGGRVEAGETAQDALVRELKEELGVDIRPGKLVRVVENFFAFQGERQHEIGLYFLAEPTQASLLLSTPGPYEGKEGRRRLEFAWFPRVLLRDLDFRPAILTHSLANEDSSFRHLVNRHE